MPSGRCLLPACPTYEPSPCPQNRAPVARFTFLPFLAWCGKGAEGRPLSETASCSAAVLGPPVPYVSFTWFLLSLSGRVRRLILSRQTIGALRAGAGSYPRPRPCGLLSTRPGSFLAGTINLLTVSSLHQVLPGEPAPCWAHTQPLCLHLLRDLMQSSHAPRECVSPPALLPQKCWPSSLQCA